MPGNCQGLIWSSKLDLFWTSATKAVLSFFKKWLKNDEPYFAFKHQMIQPNSCALFLCFFFANFLQWFYHWIDPCSDVVLQLVGLHKQDFFDRCKNWKIVIEETFAKVWCQRRSKGQPPESDWMILVPSTKQSVDQIWTLTRGYMWLVMHNYEILYQIQAGAKT